MTNINVYGHSTKISNMEIDYAAKFMLKILFKGRSNPVQSIDICLEKEKGVIGSTLPLNFAQTEFEITIAPKQSYKKIIETLAHELVHVKQFASKELIDRHARITWKGHAIPEGMDYWETPHEIEAYGREPGLVVYYTDHIKDKDIKFFKTKKTKST